MNKTMFKSASNGNGNNSTSSGSQKFERFQTYAPSTEEVLKVHSQYEKFGNQVHFLQKNIRYLNAIASKYPELTNTFRSMSTAVGSISEITKEAEKVVAENNKIPEAEKGKAVNNIVGNYFKAEKAKKN